MWQVSDIVLTAAFQGYTSFNKAKVVKNNWNKKSKGYGFASFQDPIEGARVLKEMQGAYIGAAGGEGRSRGGSRLCPDPLTSMNMRQLSGEPFLGKGGGRASALGCMQS